MDLTLSHRRSGQRRRTGKRSYLSCSAAQENSIYIAKVLRYAAAHAGRAGGFDFSDEKFSKWEEKSADDVHGHKLDIDMADSY